MARRVSLRSTPSLCYVLFLTILYSPLYVWTHYDLFDHFDIQLLEILPHGKSIVDDQVL
jgi:hypothetical protein